MLPNAEVGFNKLVYLFWFLNMPSWHGEVTLHRVVLVIGVYYVA